MSLFLFFSMLLLCSFFKLKELFQVKNGPQINKPFAVYLAALHSVVFEFHLYSQHDKVNLFDILLGTGGVSTH